MVEGQALAGERPKADTTSSPAFHDRQELSTVG